MKKFLLIIVLVCFSALFISCSASEGGGGNNSGGNGGGSGEGEGGDGDNGGEDVFPTDPNMFQGELVYPEAFSLNSGPLMYIDPRFTPDNVLEISQTEGEKISYMYDSYGVFNYLAPQQDTRAVFTVKTKASGDIIFTIIARGKVYYEGIDSDGDFYCEDNSESSEYIGIDCFQYWEGNAELIGVHDVNVWKPGDKLSFKLSSYFVPTNFAVTINETDATSLFKKEGSGVISLDPTKQADFLKFADVDGNIVVKIEGSSEMESMLPREIFLVVGDASLTGSFVDISGNPVGAVAEGLPVILYNSDTQRRFIAKADKNGQYNFPSLPSGNYFFQSGDIKARFGLMGNVDIGRSDNIVVENLLNDRHAKPVGKSASKKQRPPLVNIIVQGKSMLNKAAVPRRSANISKSETVTTGCYKSSDNSSYKAVSGLEEQVCEDNFTIAEGSKLVGITVSVRTEERLRLNTTKYLFTDLWGFELAVDNITNTESGSIPFEFSKGGLGVDFTPREYEYCMNVSKLADKKNMNLSVKLLAKDTNDDKNPTSILVNIKPTCATVMDFGNYKHSMLNNDMDKKVAISGALGKKSDEPVISLFFNRNPMLAESYSAIHIPMKVAYVADNETTMDKSQLFLIYGNNKELDLYEGVDNFLLHENFQALTPKEIKQENLYSDVPNIVILKNDDFILPVISNFDEVYGNLNDINDAPASFVWLKLVLTFKAKDKNKKGVYDNIKKAVYYYRSMNNSIRFTPLFEIRDVFNNQPDYIGDNSKRRYPNVDSDNFNGGDGWGRKSTLEWLDNTSLRFGDISSLHGARYNNTTNNILGHSTHSDGRDIDIKYSNPIANVGKFANKANIDNFSEVAKRKGFTATYDTETEMDRLMNKFSISRDNFTYENKIYKYIENNVSKSIGWLNGTGNGSGIRILGNLASDVLQLPNVKTLINDNSTLLDNSTQYANLILYRNWIMTNRLLIERYKTDAMLNFNNTTDGVTVFTGLLFEDDASLGSFENALTWGRFPLDNSSTTGLPIWRGSKPAKMHYHHWHIQLPKKIK